MGIYGDFKKWLDAHPLVRFALARATMALLGIVVGVLATLGVLDPAIADALQRALGL